MKYSKWSRFACAMGALVALVLSAVPAAAQGVTTAAVTGTVKDDQGGVIPGATVVAVHQPSGTTYEGVSQADGRFFIPGMRVGGPYTSPRRSAGSRPKSKTTFRCNLGVAQDVAVRAEGRVDRRNDHRRRHERSGVQLGRTGAATAVTRDELATLPTISGRITDITRLTPQYGGNGIVRRPGQPREQHDGRRLVLQQLVRPRRHHRRHRRPHRRRADLARGDRAGAGQRRAVRRAPGQLHRRRHQHRHPQRHQQVHRLGLPPLRATSRTSATKRLDCPSIRASSRPTRPACGRAARSSRTSCSRSAPTKSRTTRVR